MSEMGSHPTPEPGGGDGDLAIPHHAIPTKPSTAPISSPSIPPIRAFNIFMEVRYFLLCLRERQNEFTPKYTNISANTAATATFPNPASPRA